MSEETVGRRKHARHPIQLPLAVRPSGGTSRLLSKVGDLSEGGLSFTSPSPMPRGASVELEFPVYDRRFTLEASVASCVETANPTAYRVGLAFLSPTPSFRLKLAEQVLTINQLRRDLSLQRGTEVTLEEAGQLWVEQYASIFADLYPH